MGQSTYLDGGLKLQQNGLGNEDLAGLGAEETDLRFQELHLLARTAAPHLQEAIDDRVQIHFLIGHNGRTLTKDGEKGTKRKGKRKKKHARREELTSGGETIDDSAAMFL